MLAPRCPFAHEDPMAKRRYTVTVSAAEAARLRAFDNAAEGRISWPLGENRGFLRRNATTFVVKDWAAMGVGRAAVMTLGTAVLGEGNRVDVVVRTKSSWIRWLLVVCGAVCLAVVPRDGLAPAVLGAVLILAGWFLFPGGSGREDDLDQIERVLRGEITGDWRPADAELGAGAAG